jgi:hypothetical protein
MAIDSDLPLLKPLSIVSPSSNSSKSSSLLPYNNRKRLVQVATNNSATFIQFPKNAHQTSPFVPVSRFRTSHSLTRLSSPHTVDTQSLSNQSKSSENAPTSSIASGEHKRDHSQQRMNPILNNPLLNHRREKPKSSPIKSSKEYLYTTRHCLSSKPLKATSNDTQIQIIRATTAPILAHQKEINTNLSDRVIISIDNQTSEQKQTQYVDDNKYDYITRWLNEVRAATYSNGTLISKTKRTKRRFVPS